MMEAELKAIIQAAGRNERVKSCHPAIQRPAVVGIFEPVDKALATEQAERVKCFHEDLAAGEPHPRDYIHRVPF